MIASSPPKYLRLSLYNRPCASDVFMTQINSGTPKKKGSHNWFRRNSFEFYFSKEILLHFTLHIILTTTLRQTISDCCSKEKRKKFNCIYTIKLVFGCCWSYWNSKYITTNSSNTVFLFTF